MNRGDVTWEDAPPDTVVWGVYGPDCFPTIFPAKMKDYFWNSRAIWGFSIYNGVAGFRTLGVGKEWADKHDLRLFLKREDAVSHVMSLFAEAEA